jgi:hypothetical protein
MFLVAVGGLAAIKFAVPLAVANVPPPPSKTIKQADRFLSAPETTMVGSTSPQQAVPEPPLTKTDKVAVPTAEPIPIKTTPVVVSPRRETESQKPNQPVKIVSRHWRDPLAPKLLTTKAAKSVRAKKTAKLSP